MSRFPGVESVLRQHMSPNGRKQPTDSPVHGLQGLELGQGFFSAVTFGEIQKGVELTRRQDPVKANEIEPWAAQLERASRHGCSVFSRVRPLMHRRPATLGEDALIAARARDHGLTVATRNELDFAHFDVAVVNPFK